MILKWGSRTGHPSTLHRPEYPHTQELFRSGNNLYSTIIPLLQLWSCLISWFIIQAAYRVGREALRSTLRLPKESNTSACARPLLLYRTKSTILVVLYFQKFVFEFPTLHICFYNSGAIISSPPQNESFFIDPHKNIGFCTDFCVF